MEYDEYILYVDHEFNRLMKSLEKNNLLDNTYVVLTSDHGEMFERGLFRHKFPTFHQPLVNIPLLIFPPGHKDRIDIHQPTSAIDIIPSLLHIAGYQIPELLEGNVLSPFSNIMPPDRPVFSMDARRSNQKGPFTTTTVMLRQNNYKLAYYFGDDTIYKVFNGKPYFELYDIEKDPEELNNLWESSPKIGNNLLNIIQQEMRLHNA